MASPPPILEAVGLGKVYPGPSRALSGADLAVRTGEFVAVIGASGAGKSTLLRCMNRLVEPTEGRLLLDGRDVTRAHGARLRRLRQRVGMIFQQFGLVSRLTVLQNVLAGRLRFARSPWRAGGSIVRWFAEAERAEAMSRLELVGIAELAHKRASDLSGGQQQRVAIARALSQECGLILADEPIASLDPRSAEVVMDTLADVCERTGVPVVVNLHQVDVARRYATRVIGMHAGRIVHDGAVSSLDSATVRRVYGDESGRAAAEASLTEGAA